MILIKQKPRFTVKANKTEGVVNYDADNAYPQRVADIVRASAMAAKCTNVYGKFIAGQGFADAAFARAPLNDANQGADALLRLVAGDMALYQGFALHINYNGKGQIVQVQHVPFEHCRWALPPDGQTLPTHVCVYDDWGRIRYRTIKRDKIDVIPLFNPSPAVVEAQAEAAEGWDNYKGQILYYSAAGAMYPTAVPDPVLEDCVTDAEIKLFKWRNISTNFMASHLYINRGIFESDASRAAMVEALQAFQGADNAGKIMLVESTSTETDPTLVKVDVQENDSLFKYTEESVQQNIRFAYGIPGVLVGVEQAGKLGNSQEIEQAINYYSYQTTAERLLLQETFEAVCKLHINNPNPTNNYTINPLRYEPANLAL